MTVCGRCVRTSYGSRKIAASHGIQHHENLKRWMKAHRRTPSGLCFASGVSGRLANGATRLLLPVNQLSRLQRTLAMRRRRFLRMAEEREIQKEQSRMLILRMDATLPKMMKKKIFSSVEFHISAQHAAIQLQARMSLCQRYSRSIPCLQVVRSMQLHSA